MVGIHADRLYLGDQLIAENRLVRRVNKATNPTSELAPFASGASYFGTGGAGTITRVSGGLFGTYCTRATWTTGNTAAGSGSNAGGGMGGSPAGIGMSGALAVTDGQSLALSLYARPSRSTYLQARCDFTGSGAQLGVATLAPAGVWTRLGLVLTIPPGAGSLYPAVRAATGSPSPAWLTGDTLDIDGVLIEDAAAVLPYFDGSFAETSQEKFWWYGAEHGSSSGTVAPQPV